MKLRVQGALLKPLFLLQKNAAIAPLVLVEFANK